MKERPILFKGEMVRAILAGNKTQTRRTLQVQPPAWTVSASFNADGWGVDREHQWLFNDAAAFESFTCNCPQGQIGDRLWVKETFQPKQLASVPTAWRYRATDEKGFGPWKPSIFMTREASRIDLEIVEVRVERLQHISDGDCAAEGCVWGCDPGKPWSKNEEYRKSSPAAWAYRTLWNSINLKPSTVYETGADGTKLIVSYQSYPWSNADFDAAHPGVRGAGLYRGKPIIVTENPWVWVIGFNRLNP